VTVVGVIAVFFGFCFVVVALITVLLRFGETRLLRRVRAAPRRTCAELLAPGPLPRSVLLTGRTAPGRDGVLRSPAYDTECVWYETDLSSGANEDRRLHLRLTAGGDSIRLEDGTGSVLLDLGVIRQVATADHLRQWRHETTAISRHGEISSGTGVIRLQESGVLPDSVHPRFGHRQLDLSEETIAVGLEVSVLARPERTAHGESVILRRKGLARHRAPDAWIARLEEDRRTALQMIIVFPLIGVALTALGAGLIWIGAF
jgi:hypothetical protein